MKFRNISSFPRYNTYSQTTLNTGESTCDINILHELLSELLKDNLFEPMLTQEERSMMVKLLQLSHNAERRDVTKLPGYDDPTGEKALINKQLAKDALVKQIRKQKIVSSRKIIDSRKDRVLNESGASVEPKLLHDKPKSLSDIIGHNAAINNKETK